MRKTLYAALVAANQLCVPAAAHSPQAQLSTASGQNPPSSHREDLPVVEQVGEHQLSLRFERAEQLEVLCSLEAMMQNALGESGAENDAKRRWLEPLNRACTRLQLLMLEDMIVREHIDNRNSSIDLEINERGVITAWDAVKELRDALLQASDPAQRMQAIERFNQAFVTARQQEAPQQEQLPQQRAAENLRADEVLKQAKREIVAQLGPVALVLDLSGNAPADRQMNFMLESNAEVESFRAMCEWLRPLQTQPVGSVFRLQELCYGFILIDDGVALLRLQHETATRQSAAQYQLEDLATRRQAEEEWRAAGYDPALRAALREQVRRNQAVRHEERYAEADRRNDTLRDQVAGLREQEQPMVARFFPSGFLVSAQVRFMGVAPR